MSRWRNQRGVAMVTVLMVGASLTVIASTATYVAIDEFSATQGDRNAAAALSFAEAGVERMVLKIRNADLTWNDISRSNCDAQHPLIQISGTIGTGSYTTTLEPYDPTATGDARFPPALGPCPATPRDVRATNTFVVESTGQQPQATRLVRQILEIKPLGLPIGVYAYERIDANGEVNLENISLVSEGSVFKRNQMDIRGVDPYYKVGDFYGTTTPPLSGYRMPAAVHAKGTIYYGPASQLVEHREGFEPNCEANPKGTTAQSLWDGSGTAVLTTMLDCVTWPGASTYPGGGNATPDSAQPPVARFTETDRRRVAPEPTLSEQDYLTLKTAAKQTGLYCDGATRLTLFCSKAGGPRFGPISAGRITTAMVDASNDPMNPITARSFVVYIDFANDGSDPFLRDVQYTGGDAIGPCNTNPAQNRSAVVIVRHGSFDFAGGGTINGALIVPEGQVTSLGGFTLEGTLITRRMDVRGDVTIRLSDCWLANLPGPFLDTSTTAWTEVDR